jgi:hypothetical protein
MNNFDIWTRLNIIIRKDKEGGSFTPDEFEELLRWANIETFKKYYDVFESDQRAKDALRFFLVKETITLDSNGRYDTALLSSTYAHFSSAIRTFKSLRRPIDLVTDLEYADRVSSSLKAPTDEHPIVNIYEISGSPTFQFEPLRSVDVDVTYIRRPVDPVFAFTLDANDNIVYDSGNSTELEWDDEEKINVIYLILQKIGINLPKTDALQYGLEKEDE